MPALLSGAVQYPANFAPYYIYTVTLVASPASFKFMDILFPDSSGNFDRLVTNDAVLTAGYCFALQDYDSTQTTVQVASPGSVVPFTVDNTVRPFGLVKVTYGSSVQSLTAAVAADLAAGKVLGRMRNHHDNSGTIRMPSANDIVIILTGAC